ncbi:MAG: SRPBCC domain-containing protein [Pseudomonadota bacterium]|nr:SRPBCC domain-containing protein [Pseudomonadota bacterium]
MYEAEETDLAHEKSEPILIAGAHDIPLPRREVWRLLNDPAILRQSVRGTEEVVRLSPGAFRARIGVRVGPLKVKVSATLRLRGRLSPESFCADSELSVGLLGGARAHVEVFLISTGGGAATWVNYLTKLSTSGPLALMLRLREDKLARYTDWFFERFLKAAKKRKLNR